MAVRTVAPSFYLLPPWLGLSWRPLLRAISYPNSDRRDLRIDLLRGLCVFAMIVDHVGGSSWLYGLTGGNRWFVSAAEGFVFLSGLTMGLVYRERVQRAGLWAAGGAALRRAATLYLVTVTLTLLFTALARLTELAVWVDRELAAGEPLRLLVGALTLHYTYHGTDILALYTLLVTAAPVLFYLLEQGRAAYVLAGSWGLWLGYQLFPEQFLIPWTIRNSENFPPAAWQALFVSGMLLGWYRQAAPRLWAEFCGPLQAWQARPRTAPVMLSFASPALALASVGWIGSGRLGELTLDPLLGLFAKPNLGPARIALFLAIFVLAYLLLTLAWLPISRGLSWLLLPLGQNSLYGYTMQLFMILPLYNLFGVGADEPERALLNSLGQIAAVAAIWLMVKRRLLFGIVPR
jgi:hypothetical protein